LAVVAEQLEAREVDMRQHDQRRGEHPEHDRAPPAEDQQRPTGPVVVLVASSLPTDAASVTTLAREWLSPPDVARGCQGIATKGAGASVR
jgi:hypothetical protein